MQRILILTATIFISFGAFAQLDRSLAIKVPAKVPPCFETTYLAQKNIPSLYIRGNVDSISSLLEDWESVCGGVQEARHLRILLDIKADSFKVADKKWLLNTLVTFKEAQAYGESSVSGYRDYYLREWQQLESDYNAFIERLASEVLAAGKTLEPIEADLLNYYSGNENPLFKNLRRGKYNGTNLQEEFDERVNIQRYSSGAFFAFYGGMWIPTNNLSSLGTHPDLGLKLGGYTDRLTIDLNLGFRFVDAPSDYRVLKNDSIYQSNQYSGFYIGAGMGYALYRGVRSQFDVATGLAYDQITMYASDEEIPDAGLTIRSLNLKTGVEYKYFYNIKSFVALGCSYNFLNYKNNINDDLYGGAVTVHLIWGFTGDYAKRRELKLLGY